MKMLTRAQFIKAKITFLWSNNILVKYTVEGLQRDTMQQFNVVIIRSFKILGNSNNIFSPKYPIEFISQLVRIRKICMYCTYTQTPAQTSPCSCRLFQTGASSFCSYYVAVLFLFRSSLPDDNHFQFFFNPLPHYLLTTSLSFSTLFLFSSSYWIHALNSSNFLMQHVSVFLYLLPSPSRTFPLNRYDLRRKLLLTKSQIF